jgi:prostaglandin-endoperoxide synthase 2
MGPLMLRMVAYDAFTQALTNPLLSKEVYGENTFSDVGFGEIEKTEKLADLVRRNVREDRRENLFCSFDFRDRLRSRGRFLP